MGLIKLLVAGVLFFLPSSLPVLSQSLFLSLSFPHSIYLHFLSPLSSLSFSLYDNQSEKERKKEENVNLWTQVIILSLFRRMCKTFCFPFLMMSECERRREKEKGIREREKKKKRVRKRVLMKLFFGREKE